MLFARLLSQNLLLDDEPGGAAVAEPPATTEGQPSDSPPASESDTTASDTPAEGDTATPAEQEGQQPADIPKLSPETRAALLELHGEDFMSDPALQARIDAAADAKVAERQAAQRSDPQHDTFFQELSNDAATSWQTMTNVLAEAKREGFIADPDALEKAVADVNDWYGARDRRATAHSMRLSVGELIGMDERTEGQIRAAMKNGDDTKSFDPMHVAFLEASTVYNRLTGAARQMRATGQSIEAAKKDGEAHGRLLTDMFKIAHEHGISEGRKAEGKTSGKRAEAAAHLASEAARRELEAVGARTRGAMADGAAGINGSAPKTLTYDQLQKMKPEEVAKLSPETVKDVVDRAIGS